MCLGLKLIVSHATSFVIHNGSLGWKKDHYWITLGKADMPAEQTGRLTSSLLPYLHSEKPISSAGRYHTTRGLLPVAGESNYEEESKKGCEREKTSLHEATTSLASQRISQKGPQETH